MAEPDGVPGGAGFSSRVPEALGALAAGATACALAIRPVASGDAEGPGLLLLLASIAGLAAYAAALSYATGPGWPRGAGRGWGPWLLLFAGWLAISPVWAVEKFNAVVAAGTTISHLLLAGTILLVARTVGTAAACARALAATAVVVSAYACFQGAFLLPELSRQIAADPAILRRFAPEQQPEFLARLSGGEVFGTFFNPNSLAGFLALLLPMLVALASRPGLAGGIRIARGLLALIVAAALLWTKSKGGIGAAGVGLVVWIAIATRARWTPSWKAAAALLVLTAVVGGGAFVAMDGPARIHAARHNLSSSLGVRLNYWAAAGQLFLERPVTGLGPDNFATPYLRVKDFWSGETSRVHNDYLQVAVELGGVGLALFLGTWIVLALRGVRGSGGAVGLQAASGREGRSPAGPVDRWPPPRAAIPIGACLALVMADLLTGSLRLGPGVPVVSGVVAAMVWSGAWTTLGSRDDSGRAADAAVLPAALAGGLAAAAIHALVDFDLTVDGVAQTIWAVGAILLAMRVPVPDLPARPLGFVGQASLSLGGAAALIAMASGMLPRLMEADVRREEARALPLQEALESMERACERNPWSSEFAHERALLRHGRCVAVAAEVAKAPMEDLPTIVKLADRWVAECTVGTDAANRLNPEAPGIDHLQGISQENHAALYHALSERLGGTARERALELERIHRDLAESADARAALEYRTRAFYAWRHARHREAAGDSAGALLWFRLALEADRVTDLSRLKLDDASRTHAEEAVKRLAKNP
ncbi:MAG: O-antigen ligase family protein [Planctomycetes bacterium]|nr:O-antigen ligase family protein [Planctomycetota bacterium]